MPLRDCFKIQRKECKMKKRLLAMVVVFAATVPLMADTQSEWYASLSNKREATSVTVGGESWSASDKNKPLPYRFPCGAVLRATAGSLRLDLNSTIITNGIYADGDFAILLSGNSYVKGGIRIYSGVESKKPLLIFGSGSLTITGGWPWMIYSSELSICAGASVTIHRGEAYYPLGGEKLVVSGSSLSIFSPDGGVMNYDDVNILDSAVTMCAQSTCIEASNAVIERSVVNVLSQNDWAIYANTVVCRHSYLSCVSCSRSGILAGESHFDNSLVKVYGRSKSIENAGTVVFGEGDYYTACDHPSEAGAFDITGAISGSTGSVGTKVIINGGHVYVCSVGSNEKSCALNASHFKIDAGSLEVVDKIDVREFLKYDAAAAATYTGMLASGVDATSLMANFYSQVILDAISNDKIGDLEGIPNIGIYYSGLGSCTYTQNCGTVWCDLAKYGVMCRSPVVNGGSYKGQFYNPSYSRTVSGEHDTIDPLNSSGDSLKSVPYTVAGAKKYDKITQSLNGVLPSYYGTGSLYADAAGKLYFWVPESWKVPGGGSGGGTSGGGSGGSGGGTGGGAGTTTDLAFYVPIHYGWAAPLIVSSDPFATSPQNVFEQGEPICLNYAFNNAGDGSAVSNFVNRFTLSNGCHWEDSWDGYVLSTDGWGWLGYNLTPDFLNGLPPGDYTLTCELNVDGELPESNTANNTRSVSFRIKGADLTVSKASVHKEVITLSESVTLRWRVANLGDGAAGKSQSAIWLYDVSNGKLVNERNIGYVPCDSLAASGSYEFAKTFSGKSLGLGVHNIAVWADGKGEIAELDESNNYKLVYIEVVAENAAWSKSNVDWQFNKIKGEPDDFFLSDASNLKKKATTFIEGNPMYVRCCWWNAKKVAVNGNMRVRVVLNGGSGVYVDRSSFAKNYYYYLADAQPGFLQDLPAGNYTLTAILDSENAWQEANEKNNVKTIAFKVVGRPTIFCESSYRCALNEPVSWPVTIYGKATVKGLPAGLKYSGGAISGKATKAGTYPVTFLANNEAGAVSRAITINVVDPGFNVSCVAQPNGASVSQNLSSGAVVDMMVGVKQFMSLSAVPGMVGVANSSASTISAKGLPPGLKLSNGTISGVPTKSGSYAASITFKNKLGWTASFDLKFVVSPIPEWSLGMFGGGCGAAWDDGARYEFTTSSAGKLSGKVFRLGETWTMTAPSSSALIAGKQDEFVFDVTLKSGKTAIDAQLYVWDSGYDSIGISCLVVEAWGMEAYGARTVWTSGICAEAIGQTQLIGETITIEGSSWELLDGEFVNLVLGKDGVVKASAKFVSGAANGKTTFKTVTTSARLIPWNITEESGIMKVEKARLILYFPPLTKNAPGKFFSIVVTL